MKLFPETALTREAKQSRFRHLWIIDLLIAVLLLFVAQQIESIVLFPAVIVWALTGVDFEALVEGGDPSAAMNTVMEMLNRQPDWISLLSLVLTVVVIIVVLIYCTKIERRPAASVGFRGKSPFGEYIVGYLLGIGMLTLAWAICLAAGTAELKGVSPTLSWMLVPFFAAFLIQGMSEEVLCRGFLMQTLSTRYRGIVAVAVNAVFFAALHLMNSGLTLLAFINLVLFGAFASVYMWRCGSIWGVAALHSAWNFTQGNLLGIRVSGQTLGPSVLVTDFTETGSWINGGAFGLEGGVAVTAVLVIGIVVLLLMPTAKDARIPQD